MITHSLDVLIGHEHPQKKIAIKSGDSGVNLEIKLHQKRKYSIYRTIDELYTMPTGAYAILEVAKLDKKKVLQRGECSGSSAVFSLDPQALTVVGLTPTEVIIYGSDGRRITSATFYIDVLERAGEGSTEDSETYVDIINEQIQRAEDAAKRSEEAAAASHGATFTPHVSEDGDISWENDKELENPEPVNIKGPQGATFTPQVSENGDVSWTNDKGLKNPDTVNIRGPQGATTLIHFDIDTSDGNLYLSEHSEDNEFHFELNKNGDLEVVFDET